MFFSRVAALAALAASAVTAVPTFEAEAAPASLERRFTANGDTDNIDACVDLSLVWFRSGYEGQGRLGLLGDPLCAEIQKYIPSSSCYNARYDTNLYEEVFTNIGGGIDATNFINRKAKQCPNQRFFVAGYSKGTLPLHQVYALNPGRERIVASLAIGDFMKQNPYVPPAIFNSSWPSNGDYSIRSLCNYQDEICDKGGKNHEIHLFGGYINQIPAQVQWMLDLYYRNLKAPFKYQWTLANH